MRRNWKGRYRNNWNRANKNSNSGDSRSVINSSTSGRISSTAGSSRAPANQLPIIVPINTEKNIWKLYFPSEGMYNILIH